MRQVFYTSPSAENNGYRIVHSQPETHPGLPADDKKPNGSERRTSFQESASVADLVPRSASRPPPPPPPAPVSAPPALISSPPPRTAVPRVPVASQSAPVASHPAPVASPPAPAPPPAPPAPVVPPARNVAPPAPSISRSKLTDAQVYEWLHSLNLGEHYEKFMEHDITFDILPYLSKKDLKCISAKVGDRIRIFNALFDLDKWQSRLVETIGSKESKDAVKVRVYTLQNKALDVYVSQKTENLLETIFRTAKVADKRVFLNNGFDVYASNASLQRAILDEHEREFWMSVEHSRPLTNEPSFHYNPNDDTDTLTLTQSFLARNFRAPLRPTSAEVALNISQFFPDTEQELLERGLRNSVILENRLSSIAGSDWRSSVRMSRRYSTLPTIDLEDLNLSDSRPLEDTLAERRSVLGDAGLDFHLLEQFNSEEMSPTQWLRGKLIGSGSFGSVYLAFNVFTGDIMAVKQVQISAVDQRQKRMLEALHHEIEMLRAFEHANIVQYKGFKKEGEFLNIFLEYVPGGSLASKLAFHGALDEDKVRHYISQCLRGLEYLHDRGIIHRDIKGANILVDTFDRVKISDFGLSKHEDAARNRISTQGTAFWMAPEVARAKERTTTKADVWSLGCLIVELITGQHPFPDLQAFQVLYRVGKGDMPAIPDNTSPELKDVLERCFVVDQSLRASAKELLQMPFFSKASM